MHHALVVSEIFPPAIGGSGELFRNIYSRFANVAVTVLTEPAPNAEPVLDGMTILREPLSPPYWGLLRPSGLRHHLRRAMRIRGLSRSRPTVVHAGRPLPEGVDAWLASNLKGSPYICWAHGEDIASASMSREFAGLMRRVYGSASAVMANSRNTADMLRRVDPRWEHINIVYPGVDTNRFRPDVPGALDIRARLLQGADLLLLTVGRLQRRKGHDLTLEALAGLGDAGRRIRYVIAGDGDQRSRLETLSAELGLQDRVRFEGVVPDAMLPGYYAAADVFVHPNRIDGEDVEGFGIVFLEAAAAGVCVIGGNSGGVPEAVAAGETGLLVSGTSAEELQQALQRLIGSAELRRTLGAQGRARVEQCFSWARAASEVQAIHERIARGERQSRPHV